MKKILYLHAGAELYGADIVLLQLVKNLDRSKFQPYVVLPCAGPLVDKLKEAGVIVEVIEYPILRRKYFNFKGIFNYAGDMFRSLRRLKKFCVENSIDIIHANTSAVLEGVFLKRKMKLPLVWHIHEIIVKPKAVYKFISFLISKGADYTISVSNAVEKHLKDSGFFRNKKTEVIYNGVDNNKFNPHNDSKYLKEYYKIEDDEVVVGMIGRINSWKGQEDFIDAMNTVLKENRKVKAVLIGGVFEGEEWRIEKLKAKISSNENADRIMLDNFREDNANVHCLFDIFVLPSINPDPLPTVVLEAMASGKPVVAYKHGGVTEMVVDNFNGLFASVRNTDELAFNINKLIIDDYLRKEMGKNSYLRQREFFSLDSYVHNFEKLYEKAIEH